MNNLQKGVIYQHANFGMLEYIRVDNFHGERTLEFRQVSNGKSKYLFPSEVEAMLAPQETIETVKQQRDELLAALTLSLAQMEGDTVCIESVFCTPRSLDQIEKDGDLPNAILVARAAIAKAKGGAA